MSAGRNSRSLRWVEPILLPVVTLQLLVAGAFGSQEAIGYTLYYATNFIFTGLAVAVAFHAGLFNIGAEGQAYIGGLGVGLVCLGAGSLPFWVVLPLALLAAAVFGAAWAFIPAWLQAKRGSHIVITTIMFNFIASALMTWLLVNILIKPGQQSPETREFTPGTWLPSAHDLLAKVGIPLAPSPLNLAFGLALGASALVWLFIWHTRWGFALRAAGQSAAGALRRDRAGGDDRGGDADLRRTRGRPGTQCADGRRASHPARFSRRSRDRRNRGRADGAQPSHRHLPGRRALRRALPGGLGTVL